MTGPAVKYRRSSRCLLGPHEVRLAAHPDKDTQHLRWHHPGVLGVGPGVDNHEERIPSLVTPNHAAVHLDVDGSLEYVDQRRVRVHVTAGFATRADVEPHGGEFRAVGLGISDGGAPDRGATF